MIEHINVGEKPDDGKGEPLRDSLIKTNKNFKHLDKEKLGIDDTAAMAKELETPLKINGQSVDSGGEINIAESDVTKQYVDDGLAEKLDATGTAAKAKALETPMTINGQSVDSGGEINIAESDVTKQYVDDGLAEKLDATGTAAKAKALETPMTINGQSVDSGGEINSFAGSDAGLVPTATAADADKVLSGAGKWVPQSGGGGGGSDAETAKKLIKPDGTDLVTFSTPSAGNDSITMHAKRLYFPTSAAIWVIQGLVMSVSTSAIMVNVNLMPQNKERTSLGIASYTWKDCYLQNAPIVTSDLNAKTEIVDIDDAERACAVDVRKCIKKYKLKSAVAEKGSAARYHFGVIAQEVIAVFERHGLDAFAYGIVCFSEWDASPAEVDEEGNMVAEAREAGSAYAIRYDELSMFLFAAL